MGHVYEVVVDLFEPAVYVSNFAGDFLRLDGEGVEGQEQLEEGNDCLIKGGCYHLD